MITLVASTRRATAVSDDAITTRSVGIPVTLDLSEQFDGLSVTLVCKAGEVKRDVAVLDPDALQVPVECLQVAGVPLLLGLYASNAAGTKVIPTIWASAGTIRVGTEQSEVSPSDPTPDWTAQVQQWAEDAHDTAERLAEQVDGWETAIDAAVQGAENVDATVSKSGNVATISVTDREGVTHTATVSDGADGRPGADGQPGADGYSPTATVTQTASGATISITDKSGTTTASVSNGTDGTDGTDGADGYSPTVSVSTITGGHEVTITDADGAHSFEVLDGDPAEPGSITDEMLAPDGIKPQVAQLWGNQLTGELSGTIATAADAYAAPPMALTVDGQSTQTGTPTPDAPVPILSVENPMLTFVGKNWLDVHAGRKTSTSVAKDGSGVWYPYAVSNYLNNFSGNSLSIDGDTVTFTSKSNYGFGVETCVLPDTTYTFSAQSITVSDGAEYEMRVAFFRKDGTFTYRTFGTNVNRATTTSPSYAIYAIFTISVSANVISTITAKGLQLELGSTATAYESYQGATVSDLLPEGTALRSLPDGTKDELHLSYLRPSTREGWAWYSREVVQKVGMTTTAATDGITGTVGVDVMSTTGEIADGPTVLYKLATPVTTQLDPIELPVMPAPTATVWCDGGSATPSFVMEYVKDTNIVIAEMQAALADLATS